MTLSSVFDLATYTPQTLPEEPRKRVSRHGVKIGRPLELMPDDKAEIRARYQQHIAERRAAGFVRAQQGFVIGLAKEFAISTHYASEVMHDYPVGRTSTSS